ncbi:recombinase family protein [Ruegeria halocynthiae]|uniref:recombinase family protein n=1 Tax=Ruegeria halocynthiae TaxID=985054 RepID=UPI0009F44F4C
MEGGFVSASISSIKSHLSAICCRVSNIPFRQKIEAAEVSFRSIREPWADTTSSMGKFLLTVFAGLSELERKLINE